MDGEQYDPDTNPMLTDGMTPLDVLSSIFGSALAPSELEEALKEGQNIAVLAIDFDNFKDINDTLGQTTGDEVLCLAASRMRRCIPPSDTLARTGGDEFGILLHHTDLARARSVAANLIREVGKPTKVGEQTPVGRLIEGGLHLYLGPKGSDP